MISKRNLIRAAATALSVLISCSALTACDTAGKNVPEKTESTLYEKHITFTINAIGVDNAGKDAQGKPDKVFEWLKQKYNFSFEWVPCTMEDFLLEKPLLWFASNTEPDIIMLDIAPARYSYYLQWVKNGKLKPYPEFGTQYPNLQKAWDKAINGKKFEIDGKVYAYPAFTDSAKYNFLYPPWGRVYRIDWAEKVGLRTPDDVYTFEQWNDLVREVIRQDPGGNGPGNTIGQVIFDWLVPGGFGTGSLSPNMTKYVKVDGKWVWGPQLPESFEAVKLMKQLYDEGLIWKDQIIVKNDDIRNKLLSGEAFSASLSSNPESLDSLSAGYKKSHPEADPTKMFGIAFIKAADGKFLVKQTSDHWTETAMSPRLNDEETARWCDILDYLVSEEGYYMRNFGIPGEDWVFENGEVVLKWPKNEQGMPVGPSGLTLSNSRQWAGRGGNSDILNMDSPIYSEWARGLVKNAYKKLENKTDLNIIPFDTEQNYFTGPNYTQIGTMEAEIIRQCMKMLVSDNLEKDWKDWLKLMEPKVQPVLDELNANLK